MSEMPYLRGAGCDLCGAQAPLHRVELAPGSKTRLARVAYICDAHGDPSGDPVAAPVTRMAPGTGRLRPQNDELFGDVA